MKNYLKFMLIFMGIIMVLIAVVSALLISGNLNIENMIEFVSKVSASSVLKITAYSIFGVFAILSIVAIGGSQVLTKDIKGGILLEQKYGDIQIAPQAFENIILNVAKKYAGVKTSKVLVNLKETGVTVDLLAYVLQDTVISDISEKIQNDIKDTVQKQTTVEVEKVNVRVKGTYSLSEKQENA